MQLKGTPRLYAIRARVVLPSSSGFNYASAGVKQWGASGDVPIIR
jgi:hypothetical protein